MDQKAFVVSMVATLLIALAVFSFRDRQKSLELEAYKFYYNQTRGQLKVCVDDYNELLDEYHKAVGDYKENYLWEGTKLLIPLEVVEIIE